MAQAAGMAEIAFEGRKAMDERLADLDEVEQKCLELFKRFVVAIERQAAASEAALKLSTTQFELMHKRLDDLGE